jgi:hypothetical protein
VKYVRVTVVAILGLLLGANMAFAQAPSLVEGVDYFKSTDIQGVKKLSISGMQFLKIGQGARAEGMGGAFTAVSDDINAIYWNGAGLVNVEKVAYQANYTRWLAGTDLYSMAAVYNTHSSRGEVIGISVISQQVAPIEETTIFQPDGTGNMIDVGQTAVGFLYAIKFTDKFSFSAKLNYVQEVLFTQTTRTFTLDLGSYFYTGFKSLRVGMAFKNFGPDQKSQEANFSYLMPLTYNMALAGEVYGEKNDPMYLTVALESAFPIDYEQRYHLGGELWIENMFALRAGWKWNYDLESLALGAGFKQAVGGRTFTADVAYSVLKKRDGVALFDAPVRVSIGGTF